ncbi:hypothetical protein LTR66_017867 [Elasticomyces elasticus]|nr:hypothetical protein LTR66_017867 [Elasticomyces elasticus]
MVPEDEPLIEESGESGVVGGKKHGRNRSGTVGSAGTLDSLSSRGDLFPSEDEDDAVPLDDEFAMVLERRTTQSGQGENGSGKTRLGKRRSADSRMSTRTVSSRSARSSRKENRAGSNQRAPAEITQEDGAIVPSLTELKQEEERIRQEEEAEIERKRGAAQDLARRRGLSSADQLSRRNATTVAEQLVVYGGGRSDSNAHAAIAAFATRGIEIANIPIPCDADSGVPSGTSGRTAG